MIDKKLVLFFCTHFTYGMLFNIFGPIVPFLAESAGKIQSQFSYIFVIRGVSYLMAGFFQQKFLKDYCLYKRMLISCVASGICFILFHLLFHNFWVSCLITLMLNLANGSIEILINILLVSEVTGDAKQAIGFSYGFYGMGAVMGSIVVSILGSNALTFCGIWIFTIGMMYFDLVSFKKTKQQTLVQNLVKSEQITKQKMEEDSKQILNENLEKYFCHLFLLYAAISLTYRIWMPSFIVMENFASKQTAAISISIYSAVLTGFRFFFTFWSPQIIKSLINIANLTIITLAISIVSYYCGNSLFLVFGSSIILGVLFASYMPFLYALPSEFKMIFSQQGVSNTIIYYAIGQAVISAFIGCLMQWFHPIMLFISLFLLSIYNKSLLEQTICSLIRHKKQNQNPKEFELKEIS